jgi:photosystem II stability/assembly factor-like uncharacterized protein
MIRTFFKLLLFIIFILPNGSITAQVEKEVISSFPFRSLGPAFMTGRISDIVKDYSNPSTWYVATASSNVWKTTNNGTTWDPIFDNYGSYSTGCISIDPSNPNVLWLGTGENQSQRSVGWGDGVYKSLDAGKTWTNVGLDQSEHIGKILIDPRNPEIVIVAAQGPLWKEGGDRGVYRSENGGKTWEKVLYVSENTGAADVVFDPTNPDVIYASTFQRRRHAGILVAGGPESRIFKSSDNGKTWSKLEQGLPGGNLGRIAIAVSPQKSNVVYAQISMEERKGGFYKSEDHGESWEKQSDYAVVDPQYYGEMYCDPHRFDHVYTMDVVIKKTTDGGKTFSNLNTRFKHVDNHAMLFDPNDSDYMMVGCDGGIYESWDYGDTWKYHDNLPIMQFYRVGLDNDVPFYNIYGGTQDNSTIYGPSRTNSRQGITNSDWNLALGGDGFQARIDPEDPNTVYCQSQYAGIVRFDKANGHRTELQPQVGKDEDPLRWHWDSPLIISPHNNKRIYFAAQKLFRSDDRGDTWTAISEDLSRNEDRNQRKVMGKVWPPEAVWKNVFTSPYGTIVSLSESALKEGLIVVGTDDGQIQITEDGGGSWKLINSFPGVPNKAYVADIFTSQHDVNTIYAVFNNHKEGDFQPYIIKTDDLGKTWQLITEGIRNPHTCWTIYEDHGSKNLLFAGTEYGLFASVNGGENWYQMKGGLPTIPIRDLEIQQRENDLVCASFGRGFYILDDYTPLRALAEEETDLSLFDIKEVRTYNVKGNKGYSAKGVFGNNFYSAENPPSGPVLSIYLKEKIIGLKEERRQNESDSYPDYEQLKLEDFESKPGLFVLVKDNESKVVSKTPISNRKGFQRVEASLNTSVYSTDGESMTSGPSHREGSFTAQLFSEKDGKIQSVSPEKTFEVSSLSFSKEKPTDDFYQFYGEVAQTLVELRSLEKSIQKKMSTIDRLKAISINSGNLAEVEELENKRKALMEVDYIINGDETKRSRFQYYHPGTRQKLQNVYRNMFDGQQITQTHRDIYEEVKEEMVEVEKTISNMNLD